MRNSWWAAAIALLCAGCASAAEPRATLDAAAKAMGASGLNTIEYSGSGATFGFQQAPRPGGPWPRFNTNTYVVAADYTKPAMRLEFTRTQGEHPPAGGAGQPLAGETRTIQFVSGTHAWNAEGSEASPAMATVTDRRRALWKTPHGVIKAALADAGARVNGKEISFEVEGQTVTATLNDNNLVERVATLVDHPVVGDMPIVISYLDYRDYGGIKFPTHIVEDTDGFPTVDITIAEVKPNATLALDIPANVQQAQPAPPPDPSRLPAVTAEQLAEGVWFLTATNQHSLVIEFKDHVVLFEAPVDETRSMAVNAWMKATVPAKPLKYVINTHHHYDHSGGLRPYVADGIPIITHEGNKDFYEKAWARPRTINPDRLAKSPKPPVFATMSESKILTDGVRTLELHHIAGSGHHPYIIMGYLPKERIVMYADSYNPPPGADPRDLGRTNEFAINLYENMERLKPTPVTLAPIHGRSVPYTNLKKAIGLVPLT